MSVICACLPTLPYLFRAKLPTAFGSYSQLGTSHLHENISVLDNYELDDLPLHRLPRVHIKGKF